MLGGALDSPLLPQLSSLSVGLLPLSSALGLSMTSGDHQLVLLSGAARLSLASRNRSLLG
jgi:hypothetical protein